MGPLSAVYRMVLSGRGLLYKTGLKKTRKLPVRVISIGNLTLGGTGKTPAVIALAQEAKKRGFNPCILTRGYKGKAKGPCFAGMGEGPVLNAYEAGDEPVLMAERLTGIPIVMGRNRYQSGMFAINNVPAPLSIDMFILDDGFQHIALDRDTDVLLINASNPFGNGKLFPEGILREPMSAMRRGDIIVLSNSNLAGKEAIMSLTNEIKGLCPGSAVYRASHMPTAVVSLTGETESPDILSGAKVSAFSGIANPDHFRPALASRGADVVKLMSFRDHFHYHQRDIDKIVENSAGLRIITTEKDLVKLRELELPDDISALRIDFSIEKEFYDHIFNIMDV